MRLRCKLAELDPAARDYLLGVRRAGGRGAPGIYVWLGSSLPLLAFIVGPVVGGGVLFLSFGSSKDSWAVAMLQTAGVLLGGWLFLYAVRRWAAGPSPRYAGRFLYFDPLNVYEVDGEAVTVTSLETVRAVDAVAAGESGRVVFDLGADRGLRVDVPSRLAAARVADYYSALAALETAAEGPWVGASAAELGAGAVYAANEGELPRTRGEATPEFTDVPARVERTESAGSGLIGLLAVPAAAVGLFVGFWGLNAAVADGLAFAAAKQAGAPGLRAYLLDDRNTRHRDEAKALISQAYQPAIDRLKAGSPQKPAARDALVAVVDSLRTADQPVVSLVCRVRWGGVDHTPPNIASQLADGLARLIGTDLIAFANPPAGSPAHIDFLWEDNRLTLTVRTAPDGPPVAQVPLDANRHRAGDPATSRDLFFVITGSNYPDPPPPPVE